MKQHPNTIDYSQLVQQLTEQEPHLLTKISNAIDDDAETSKMALEETLKFLFLIHYSESKLTPSLKVDYAWHEFILFTRCYHDFCNQHFGRYIHHHPGGDEKENHRNYLKTLQLYILNIGAPPKELWGDIASELYEEAQCGTDI